VEQGIRIKLGQQTLELLRDGEAVRRYLISSALNGAGERYGSECTPRGEHTVRLKIGEGCSLNSVFAGRRPTGEIYSPKLAASEPDRDWILTRILWLCGQQPGYNRGGQCDTLRRYIYIHGTPDENTMGKPESHGCIRMKNNELVELFNLVYNNMPVQIIE